MSAATWLPTATRMSATTAAATTATTAATAATSRMGRRRVIGTRLRPPLIATGSFSSAAPATPATPAAPCLRPEIT
ncbi:MAG TPA: hypothetical protein VGP61_06220 [Gemmatimonadales bacterium]|nr:hypothetical protein [Gemmatimonadales bacterium]